MTVPADNSCIYLEGPWEHRLIGANGCQFHLVHAGDHHSSRPLVLLVHGFPEYWWAWRHQIAPIAQAGYEVAALDQRGLGGSDKTPDGHDGLTLTQDLAAVVRSLGASQAVIVGHGRGGTLAWSAAAMEPELVKGILTVSAPHPLTTQRLGTHLTLRTWRHVLTTFVPAAARRSLNSEDGVRRLLTEWSAPGNNGAAAQAAYYAAALRLPEATSTALEQLRWAYTSQRHIVGRQYMAISRRPITVPVWTARGQLDPLLPDRAWDNDREFAKGHYRHISLPDAGHFLPEEQPEELTKLILDFLGGFQ
ncbi:MULTISPECIES: alpha/beta hydrolase [unclassified Actinobaculum]|uniref:alpha/beta fold hydrolase n=1 Tax=unclassified Actinobaculum TaxID=2609299 RepID=UPI000D529664|nr:MULTISPECIES: alpha/beta hydrolase [unclassified Actinobaculum]AWE41609.1 alpha/beta hydrolase [Actinobaculum sp. 313]RTE49229.1 alpha/beta hydrolase [Actinobaculum sp. 352]